MPMLKSKGEDVDPWNVTCLLLLPKLKKESFYANAGVSGECVDSEDTFVRHWHVTCLHLFLASRWSPFMPMPHLRGAW